ncbi:MAG TPA: hypothetical protein VFQ61_32310 [Polyangiaceae bacterium]|nr:hypothetical protein [Polyangiaceae bacterium]
MASDCECSRAGGAEPINTRAGSWLTFAIGALVAFAPKCPLCIAAYLSLLGLGMVSAKATGAMLAPLVWPLAALLLALGTWRLARSFRVWLHASSEPSPHERR